MEALLIEEQQTKQRCTEEKQKVLTAIENWRSSFKVSDPSLDIEADQFVISAKSFADHFHFECAAERTSKRVVEDIKKASKPAKSAERMETEFTVNKQSIQDMVQRAVRQELNNHKPVSPPTKETSTSRKNSRSRNSDRSNSRSHKSDRSNSRNHKNDRSSSKSQKQHRNPSQGRNRRNSASPSDSTQN